MRFLYSEPLAHQIYAAADLLLVPSMFEPCGLTQARGAGWLAGAAALVRVCCAAPCAALLAVLAALLAVLAPWPAAQARALPGPCLTSCAPAAVVPGPPAHR